MISHLSYETENDRKAIEETNNNDSEILSHDTTEPPRKRIYNPVTGHYYEVHQRTTDDGQRGQIKGS
jgi:hypothetical protein